MNQLWEDTNQDQSLAQDKKTVGKQLATEMRKLWVAEKSAKEDLGQVQLLRARYDAVVAAMKKSPVLKKIRGPNEELRAVDSRGSTYQLYGGYHSPSGPILYEYHVPGEPGGVRLLCVSPQNVAPRSTV